MIAELSRLSKVVPEVEAQHKLATNSKIFFSLEEYLQDPELCEKQVTSSRLLQQADDDFHEAYIEFVQRFFLCCEHIISFHMDLCTLFADLQNGFFMEYTIDRLLLDTDGKQLLAETVYLFGVMLFLLETWISGPTRERLVVSYFRYSGGDNVQSDGTFGDVLFLHSHLVSMYIRWSFFFLVFTPSYTYTHTPFMFLYSTTQLTSIHSSTNPWVQE